MPQFFSVRLHLALAYYASGRLESFETVLKQGCDDSVANYHLDAQPSASKERSTAFRAARVSLLAALSGWYLMQAVKDNDERARRPVTLMRSTPHT